MSKRTLKAFDAGADDLAAIAGVRVVQAYPAFTVVEVDDDTAADAVMRTGLSEDITANFDLNAGQGTPATRLPGLSIESVARSEPDDAALGEGPHHYIVQFAGPVRDAWLAGVATTGAEVVAPYRHYAVIVRATADQVRAITALADVRSVAHLPYDERIAPAAAGGSTAPTQNAPRSRLLPGAFNVEFFKPDLASVARDVVVALGFEIIEDLSPRGMLVVRSPAGPGAAPARIDDLARVHGVKRIGRKPISRISNDRAATVMRTASAMATPGLGPGLGLSGAGEIVGVCDTGLDTGEPATIHPDFAGRIKAINSYPIAPSFGAYVTNPGADDGPSDLDSGHGTHTSGSFVGNGTSSSNLPGLAGPVRGLAYEAELVMQAIEQQVDWQPNMAGPDAARYALAGLPGDLTDLFAWAYDQGVRVHSNSWGGGDAQDYDANCGQIDGFVWNRPDFCVLFAAGNDGKDNDGDGLIDAGSVTPPGTAKNCITIGACCNDRPTVTQTNADLWGTTAAPAVALAAGDISALAPFSSRGPTRDGRIKPDVVAPGTFILSTRSRRLSEKTWGYGRYATAALYMFDCGTSMATPLAAGAVTLIRQYLRTQKAIASPSAALLKVALILGAAAIDGRGGPPDIDQGFGRVDVDAVVAPASPLVASFVEGPGLATGDLREVEVQVAQEGQLLRAVMAYSDYPGANLINDLNLVVRAPDGSVSVGNARAGESAMDSVNNVECVAIAAAMAGTWKVQVVAGNVPQGPQPYALAILAAT